VQPFRISNTRRFLSRVLVTGIAALVVIAANSAGPRWYEDLLRWLQAPSSAPSKIAANSRPPGPPVGVTPMRPEGIDSSVSPVPLPLILVRTQRGRNSREGFAQIGVRANSPQTYIAGALLANGARLTEIYDHYVVLEHEGHSVRLYLRGEVQAESGSGQGLLTVGGTTDKPASVEGSEDNLTAYLRPSPVFVGNQLHGFVLFPGHQSAPFSHLGLQPGDVLTRINGSPISEASDALSALHGLMDGNVVSVDVEREGVSQSLSLDGSILTRAVSAESEQTPAARAVVRAPTLSVAYPITPTSEE
jgi:PDZ domain